MSFLSALFLVGLILSAVVLVLVAAMYVAYGKKDDAFTLFFIIPLFTIITLAFFLSFIVQTISSSGPSQLIN